MILHSKITSYDDNALLPGIFFVRTETAFMQDSSGRRGGLCPLLIEDMKIHQGPLKRVPHKPLSLKLDGWTDATLADGGSIVHSGPA